MSFQRLIEKLMDKISNYLLIHLQTRGQHLHTMEILMHRLKENHMKINPSNFFQKRKVSYLGFRLTPNGIKPGKNRLRAVETAKILETKEDIKSFAGLCNFFKTHIKDFARIFEPLNKATRKDAEYPK